MKGLEAHVENKSPSSRTLGVFSICDRACAAGAAQRHTLTHALSQAYTLAPFFSQWQTSCRWLILEHVATELGKMSKSISLTPNLLPPLPHKPHSKVIQRATEVHFCICFHFLFLEGEGTLLWFWHVLQALCSKHSGTLLLMPITALGPVDSTSTAGFRKGMMVHIWSEQCLSLTSITHSSVSNQKLKYSYITGRQPS